MSIITKLSKFIDDSKRVLSISYKPNSEEFNKSAKIILIGILLVGVIGFIIAIIISLIISGSLSLI
ncbi:MAG: protein translocase SEC61 complex subunit gamma [Candidatus Marsarchaeota archaeon]|nr:protein translocase SEC61 complex subunit gamma [Candidatus Marsarchaeota archaeon]MCL5112290.1 protein translocase SEC61 complex subunit gamma [Candidatus Marsarchaeota archaeon]